MDERILIWALGRDGPLTCGFLSEAGFHCRACGSWEELCAEAASGVGVLVLAGELLTPDVLLGLEALLAQQPPWSDLPLVLVAAGDPPPGQRNTFENLGSVSLLHRPVSPDTLASTVRTALRARRRQYQVRDLLRQREEADRRKDEFLAMLAHELRNPLAPIRTGLQILRLARDQETAERTRALMERQVGNLSRLVEDLLDVSRITRGKITLQKRTLTVADVLEQAVEAIARQAAEKGLCLEVVPPPEPLHVDADPTRLEQMVGNVLGNAVKFTPPGGQIRLSAAREGESALIRVRDTGVGIPADQRERVFDLFAQTDRAMDRAQGGLGIGLTVVRSLAHLHGGAAEVHSEGEGKGTEVIIRLPALAAGPVPPPPPADPAGAGPTGRRVLIVEDNPDAADSLAAYLQAVGHEVAVARDGQAGIATARRQRPAVVVCDIGLPIVDGYQVVRTLRSEPDFASCVFVAVTGYGDEADRERARQAGFDHHLTKPADPREVARLVERPGSPMSP